MASIAIAGSIAQRPGRGGHAWVFLNYLLGLKRLSHDVVFIDCLTSSMLGEGDHGRDIEHSLERRWLSEVMISAGLADQYFLLADCAQADAQQSGRGQVLRHLREVDLLLNINGFLRDAELLDAPASTVFVDIDPAIQQMWEELGLCELFEGHDLYFTVGENLGRPFCEVPTCGREWRPTRTPIILDDWTMTPKGGSFTTVGSWRGPYGPIEYQGATYGLRVHEFRRFIDLPKLVAATWDVAMDIDSADERDVDRLYQAGWNLMDPKAAAGDLATYRAFIQGSLAEFSVAKNVYVRSRCGWFSDRSASYLASGRPVLAQDTGFSVNLPTGNGLLSFTDLDGAVAGSEEILGNWSLHSAAAREIALEHFDSKSILEEILDAAGI